MERLCWIPFGLQTLEVGPGGGTFPLQPKTEGCDDGDLIRLEVPGSVLKLDVGKKLLIRYGILVDGPFSLEDSYKLASMVVYIYFDPAHTTKPLNLHLPHWSSGKEALVIAMAPHKVDKKNEFKFQFEKGLQSSEKTSVIPIDGHSSLFAQAIAEGSSKMFYAFSNEVNNGRETMLRVYITYASQVWCEVSSTVYMCVLYCSVCNCISGVIYVNIFKLGNLYPKHYKVSRIVCTFVTVVCYMSVFPIVFHGIRL